MLFYLHLKKKFAICDNFFSSTQLLTNFFDKCWSSFFKISGRFGQLTDFSIVNNVDFFCRSSSEFFFDQKYFLKIFF